MPWEALDFHLWRQKLETGSLYLLFAVENVPDYLKICSDRWANVQVFLVEQFHTFPDRKKLILKSRFLQSRLQSNKALICVAAWSAVATGCAFFVGFAFRLHLKCTSKAKPHQVDGLCKFPPPSARWELQWPPASALRQPWGSSRKGVGCPAGLPRGQARRPPRSALPHSSSGAGPTLPFLSSLSFLELLGAEPRERPGPGLLPDFAPRSVWCSVQSLAHLPGHRDHRSSELQEDQGQGGEFLVM